MISVIGSERNSAFLKSSENDFESALLALAPPNCPTNTFGLSALTFATEATIGSMRLLVWSSSPRTLNSTSTERPSLETWPWLPLAYGDFTSATPCWPETPAMTSSTALRTAGSVALPPLAAWTRTVSSSCLGKWSSIRRSALPDCPM